jgi:hypothetical protein
MLTTFTTASNLRVLAFTIALIPAMMFTRMVLMRMRLRFHRNIKILSRLRNSMYQNIFSIRPLVYIPRIIKLIVFRERLLRDLRVKQGCPRSLACCFTSRIRAYHFRGLTASGAIFVVVDCLLDDFVKG